MAASDDTLQRLIADVTGSAAVKIELRRSLSGGSIHRVKLVQLTDARRFCVNGNVDAADMFGQEAYALACRS